MIHSIRLRNFESHKDTLVEFGPGVNVLTGESENGKSAILRALAWVATNRPTGDAFRSHWGGETRVDVLFKKGHSQFIVSRIKSDKDNRYTLCTDTGKLEFKAFGQDVPAEVSTALNFLPVNLQPQFESHYMLPPVSPGEVARQLNEVVDLTIIDRALANANAEVRRLTNQGLNLRSEAARHQAEADGLAWVLSASEELESLEAEFRRADELRRKDARLRQLVHDAQDVEENLHRVGSAGDDAVSISKLEILNSARNGLVKQKRDVDNLLDQLDSVQKRSRGREEFLSESLEKLAQIMPEECPLCGQTVPKK